MATWNRNCSPQQGHLHGEKRLKHAGVRKEKEATSQRKGAYGGECGVVHCLFICFSQSQQ